jgi:hypothetical protein
VDLVPPGPILQCQQASGQDRVGDLAGERGYRFVASKACEVFDLSPIGGLEGGEIEWHGSSFMVGLPLGALSPQSPKKSFLGSCCSYGDGVCVTFVQKNCLHTGDTTGVDDGGGSASLTLWGEALSQSGWNERWRIRWSEGPLKVTTSIHPPPIHP